MPVTQAQSEGEFECGKLTELIILSPKGTFDTYFIAPCRLWICTCHTINLSGAEGKCLRGSYELRSSVACESYLIHSLTIILTSLRLRTKEHHHFCRVAKWLQREVGSKWGEKLWCEHSLWLGARAQQSLRFDLTSVSAQQPTQRTKTITNQFTSCSDPLPSISVEGDIESVTLTEFLSL